MFKKIITILAFLYTIDGSPMNKTNTDHFEVDIDKISLSSYKIWINDQYYSCIPKNPPLSHSWSYECVTHNRRLRGNV